MTQSEQSLSAKQRGNLFLDLIAFAATMTTVAVLAVSFIGTQQKWPFWTLWAIPIFALSFKALFTFKDLRITELSNTYTIVGYSIAFILATALSFAPLLVMAKSKLTSDDDAMFLFLRDIKTTNDNLVKLNHEIKRSVESQAQSPKSTDDASDKTTDSIKIEIPITEKNRYHVYVNGHRIFVDVLQNARR